MKRFAVYYAPRQGAFAACTAPRTIGLPVATASTSPQFCIASGDTPARVYARTSAAGPVAATGTVVPYAIGDVYDSGSVEILEAYADGTLRGRMAIVAPALPAGGYVQVSIWSGGAQFADGTTLATLHAADFDANGIATLDVFYPTAHAISSFCHYTRLYDANGTLLSGW